MKLESTDCIKAQQIYLLCDQSTKPKKWVDGDFIFKPRKDVAEYTIHFPIDWNDDPFKDRNWCAQLHMWRMLDPFLHQYDKDHDTSWLDFPLAIVRDWHHYHHVEMRPSEYAWKDMMAGIRAMKIAYLLSQAQHEKLILDNDTLMILDDLKQRHLEFLLDHSNVLYTNHTFMDLHGAAALAQVAEAQQKQNIYDFIDHVLPKLITLQFSEAGIHLEDSPDYQPFGIGCLRRLKNSSWFPNHALEDLISCASEASDWFIMPDGRIMPFGDTNGSPENVTVGRTAFQGNGGVFNSSGYAVVRCDGGGDVRKSSFLAVMGAFHRPSHKHADDLSCVWFEGEDILCDAGKYAYKSDDRRTYAKSTCAHNTVEIDGKNFSTALADAYGSAIGAVAAYDWGYLIDANVRHSKFNVRHARFLIYRPSAWLLVIDHLIGEKPHDFTQWFHFAPHLPDPQKIDHAYHTQLRSGRRLRVLATGNQTLSDSVMKGVTEPRLQGWISHGYGQMTPNCALGYRQCGKDVVFATLLSLDDEGSTLFLQQNRLSLKLSTKGKGEKFLLTIGDHSCRVRRA